MKYYQSSFVSEHSAEYILVPKFISILSQKYKKIIPIYFWSSREGGKWANQSLLGYKVRIVGLLPRRPKIAKINQSSIEVKFNERLVNKISFLFKNSIPVFGGVPLTNNLMNFTLDTPVMWFDLRKFVQEEIFDVDLNGSVLQKPRSICSIKANNIISVVNDICKPMPWSDAVDLMRNRRNNYSSGQDYFFGLFGEKYKPVYFIIPEKI